MNEAASPFLLACAGKPAPRIPVWIMRQAGRYLPAYQEVRKQYDFLTMCHTPELAAEVTLQPVREFDMDAAILFCDILIPFEPMGIDVQFIEGKGPQLSPQVRSRADIERLKQPDFDRSTSFVGRALRMLRAALPPEKALIGFAGAPWTLACYAVEGMGSKHFSVIKQLIFSEPEAAHRLLQHLAEAVARFLRFQLDAGADAVQLFDSWSGVLAPEDYAEFSLPYIRFILDELANYPQPKILFSRDNGAFIDQNVRMPVDVLGVDWLVDLAAVRSRYAGAGPKAWQGNLDPITLLGDRKIMLDKARRLLEANAARPGWIFNLGHGITPDAPVENVRALVNLVHSYHGETP